MKTSAGISVVFCLALFGLGSAIKCYRCKDYTGTCTKTQDCNWEDSCLSLKERGGFIYRQCIKYSDCDYNRLSQMYPSVSAFTYKCCNSDLCNGATAAMAAKPLLGLLASLAVFWWCVL
ncbi:CD59 glycoprotein [Denticeps clupeoides]|uniref:CD59 glycoprotein-like n=1 Tax=Denticeps clupeoides TaxID=299321 RepID=A0AAY4CR45_9TELE|nr:CD59 glycoprotein [Denticeps clupeoides]